MKTTMRRRFISSQRILHKKLQRFSFVHNEHEIIHLSTKQVFEDQIKTRKERECEKSKEKDREEKELRKIS